MYLNHNQIQGLCLAGFMKNYDPACINAASMDVRLGDTILVEDWSNWDGDEMVIDYAAREKLRLKEVRLTEEGYIVRPGTFFLAHTIERCEFPDNMAALFRIKSSMGRTGFEHLDAGWVDPGFHGVLTLEFKNMTNCHAFRIRPGDRVGQLVFMMGEHVSEDQSYRTKGNYNGGDQAVQVGYRG